MKITTNQKMVEHYIDVMTRGVVLKRKKVNNLTIEGNKLFNYNTIIAQYENGTLYINTTKYSMTTTRIQNLLKNESNYVYCKVVFVNDICLNKQYLV